MGSKGAHTLIEALILLKQQGLSVQANLAGDSFQSGYREELEQLLKQHNLDGAVQFVGQLGRQALARFYALHHVGVFPSIHPEAFGIVAAEMMASGLVVVSSGVGGAGELIDNGRTGLLFQAGDSRDLAHCLMKLASEPTLLKDLGQAGQDAARQRFSVMASATALEAGFKLEADVTTKTAVFWPSLLRRPIRAENRGMHLQYIPRFTRMGDIQLVNSCHRHQENTRYGI